MHKRSVAAASPPVRFLTYVPAHQPTDFDTRAEPHEAVSPQARPVSRKATLGQVTWAKELGTSTQANAFSPVVSPLYRGDDRQRESSGSSSARRLVRITVLLSIFGWQLDRSRRHWLSALTALYMNCGLSKVAVPYRRTLWLMRLSEFHRRGPLCEWLSLP